MFRFLLRSSFYSSILYLCYYLTFYNHIISVYLIILFCFIFRYLLITRNRDISDGKSVTIIKSNRTRDLDLSDIKFQIIDQNSGESIPRIFKPSIIRIPRKASDTGHIDTVLCHEYAHLKNNDVYKNQLLEYILICVSVTVLYTINIYFVNIIISIILGIIIPIILNMYRHKIEYRADDFASNIVGSSRVVDRLSRNTNPYNYGKSIIFNVYPDIRDRIEKQYEK